MVSISENTENEAQCWNIRVIFWHFAITTTVFYSCRKSLCRYQLSECLHTSLVKNALICSDSEETTSCRRSGSLRCLWVLLPRNCSGYLNCFKELRQNLILCWCTVHSTNEEVEVANWHMQNWNTRRNILNPHQILRIDPSSQLLHIAVLVLGCTLLTFHVSRFPYIQNSTVKSQLGICLVAV